MVEDEKKEEEVCEIIEIEKDGKTKIKKSCGTHEIEEGNSEEQIEKENKLLRNFLIGIGSVLVIFILGYLIAGSLHTFEYNEVDVDVVKEVAPYRVGLPTLSNGQVVPYYFYLRKDPREVGENVAFDGKIILTDTIVFNGTEFECDGDGVIATANLAKLYAFLGAENLKDPEATCDIYNRYTFLQFEQGDETKIEQFNGASCYKIIVKDCEILEATEKMMFEIFSQVNENLEN